MDDLSREGAYNHVREHAGPSARTLGGVSWVFSLIALGLVFAGLYGLERGTGRSPAGMADAEAGGMNAEYASVIPAPLPAAKPEFAYRVPAPGDPEYADYQEMLNNPRFRSSVENTTGYEIPYDPEWRSVVTGRREVGPTNLRLIGGAGSLEELGGFILFALEDADMQALSDLAVVRDEFEQLLWPEFPQSRPYMRVPSSEAWHFHLAKSTKGLQILMKEAGKKRLALDGITVAEVRPFTNFTLYEGVVINVVDQDTGETGSIRAISAS
jgi:hypothetical protein